MADRPSRMGTLASSSSSFYRLFEFCRCPCDFAKLYPAPGYDDVWVLFSCSCSTRSSRNFSSVLLIGKWDLGLFQVLKNFPEIFKSITYKDFMHAYALVTSRAWGSIKGYSLVIADRNYAPGEQVQIQGNIPHHDVLREMNRELLKRHHRPISNDVNGFYSSMDSFTIKEVRSGSGKGKGIPESLRAFARVLCCSSPQVYALSLGPISSPIACERLSIQRQMARGLLNGELRVLKSASAWLRNNCDTLTTTDCHR